MFDFLRRSQPNTSAQAQSGNAVCDGCRKSQIVPKLARCTQCAKHFCPECGRLDHILQYESNSSKGEMIISAVVRCPRDGTLLEKPNPDPYISSLRDLESLHWDARSVDPKGELTGTVTFTEGHLSLARRYLAVGMTFHSSPILTFGILGGLHRFLLGQDGDAYLAQCAKDFRSRGFDLSAARQLIVELGAAMQVHPGDREHIQAILIARQFIRSRS